MGWWHRQPRRWARELADLERCFPRLRLLELGEERRALEGFVRVGEVQRFIRLLWPDTYPHQPPWLIEAEPFTDSPTSTETQLVRFRDGALCLFTHDDSADAWTPERDTVEVIQRYRDFRDADEHDIIGEQADAAVCLLRVTLRIPPGLAQLTRVPGGHGVLLTRTRADLHAWLVVHATCVSPPLPPLTWAHAPRWERALARPDLRPLPWACVTLERVTWS
ncbi:MAG: hypothetical protein H6741_30470, partial [Alphaproteobacteria bacterium]|nr:hypothetical protein [Alphaproteobacteria bacterium]